MEMIDRW